MAKLITSLSSCSDRMTAGERRTAQRLEGLLSDDALIWYDIPVGRNYRHPDFIVIDPRNGLIFLEVKDWKVSSIKKITHSSVTLEGESYESPADNPLEQARGYACEAINLLKQDPRLLQTSGDYKGNLNLAWSYGAIFTNITRRQLNLLSPDIETVFPQALTICQDEMTESALPADFQRKISGLFTTRF